MKKLKTQNVTETSVLTSENSSDAQKDNSQYKKRKIKKTVRRVENQVVKSEDITRPKKSLTSEKDLGSQDIQVQSVQFSGKLDNFILASTEKRIINSLSSYKGVNLVESREGFTSFSGAYTNVLTPTTFEEKEILRQALSRPEFQGKILKPFVPRALSSDKIVEINDELGDQIDRLSLSGSSNRFGLHPDAINLSLNLNISGRIPQDSDLLYSSYDVSTSSGTLSTIEKNKLSFFKFTTFDTATNAVHQATVQSRPEAYTEQSSSLNFNTTRDIDNHSYSADIASVNNKVSFKKAFNNLIEFYGNSPDFRLFNLVEDDILFRSLLDSPIQTATLLYILIDSLSMAISNANLIDAKTGFVDEGVRFFLNMTKNESKLFKMFISDANEFLKLVPVNMEVVHAWKSHSTIGTLFESDIVGEFNPVIIPQFILNFEKNGLPNYNHTDTNQALRFRSTVDKTSVRANLSDLLRSFIDKIKSYINPIKLNITTIPNGNFPLLKGSVKTRPTRVDEALSFASVSPGFISHFLISLYLSEVNTGQPFKVLKDYSLQTLSFWEHLQRAKVFEGTNFQFLQIPDIDFKTFTSFDKIPVSSLGLYLEDLYLSDAKRRKIPFYKKDELNNVRLQKTQLVHVYSEVEKLAIQTHTKFLLVEEHSGKLALDSIFLMDSIIHPYLLHNFRNGTQILSNNLQSVNMLSYNHEFTHGNNKNLQMVPVSFLWSGYQSRELEKYRKIKFDVKKPEFYVKNFTQTNYKPSNGAPVSNSSYLVDVADIEYFWNHFDSSHDLSNLPIFRNNFKFNNTIIPDIFTPLWRAPGFLKVYEFENAYIKDLFSVRDVQSYRSVGTDFVSREEIKL